MLQNIIKVILWLLGAITALCSAVIVVGIVFFLCFHEEHTIYDTPWGKIKLDTAKIAMIDYYSTPPRLCYIVHKSIAQEADSMLKVNAGDTIWYCLTEGKSTHYFYLVKHDSIGNFQVWLWDKYNCTSWPEITKYFKQKQIFVE